jgi:hypothetical protein
VRTCKWTTRASSFTDKGRDEVLWADVTRARIVTTSAGPWGEDAWFVLEGPEGRGCIVPHDAAVRTKLLEEMQARLAGVDDRKVIEAMGSTSQNTFIIYTRERGGPKDDL